MYVIVVTDRHHRMYVAKPGSAKSCTNKLERARTFSTREEADKNRCPQNEVIVPVSAILHGV